MSVHKVTPRSQPAHAGRTDYQPPPPPQGGRVRHLGGPRGEKRSFSDLPALFGPTVRKQTPTQR